MIVYPKAEIYRSIIKFKNFFYKQERNQGLSLCQLHIVLCIKGLMEYLRLPIIILNNLSGIPTPRKSLVCGQKWPPGYNLWHLYETFVKSLISGVE